jgi:ATP-dependent DNA helicase RecG
VEYKEGWNPCDIIHTICAFANDYDNVNGGYIVIGIAANEGIPVLPPKGVEKDKVDVIQQEVFQYCNQIEPRYIPTIEVITYPDDNTYLIYLKCSAGDAGPYRAPKDVYSKNKREKNMCYWIRPGSVTTIAKKDEIAELFDKFNAVPFDDRVNRSATISHIRRGYVDDFIRESNSSLVSELDSSSLEDLLIAEEVAHENDTQLDIRNIGVLMFADRPDKLIAGARIELIKFNSKDAEESDDFIEKVFIGPIWKQVRDVLDYIKANIIEEKVVKIHNQAKAKRYYNYPYNALEEAIVNAVFHKSYREAEPVEIRIYVDNIQIINYPGLGKWINLEQFLEGKVRARKYRNRRIGELFKEIDLAEKRGTGISKILRELRENGSPEPEYEMDEERNYLITVIHIHEGFKHKSSNKVSDKVSDKMSDKDRIVLDYCVEIFGEQEYVTAKMLAEVAELGKSTARRYLNKFCEMNIVESDGKNKGTKYYLKDI